jgi:hypothetical protein
VVAEEVLLPLPPLLRSPTLVLMVGILPPSPLLSLPLVAADGMAPLLLLRIPPLVVKMQQMSPALPLAAVAPTVLELGKTALKSLDHSGMTRLRVAPELSLAGLNLTYSSSLAANNSG